MLQKARPESVLFITLDSCRYDTFIGAEIPNLRAVGPVYRCIAQAISPIPLMPQCLWVSRPE